jgi:hypothetical protein
MANKRFWLGILVLALVFGMMVFGCEEEDAPPPPYTSPNTILSVSISLGSDDDTPKVDSSLSAEVKTRKEDNYGVSYQWKRGTYSYSSTFENISGATSRWYTPTVEDAGKYIKVEVKNSDTPNPKESSAVGPVVDARPGKTPSYPTNLVSSTNLGVMTSSASGWRQLLTSIENKGDYINLDLSACTMSGTSFNPDSTVETGKKYIVSIILPTVATSIEAETGTSLLINSTFKNFNNLISVSGDNIITIGKYSFHNNSKLKNVNFPKATTIGELAFYWCGLENTTFPLAQTIGVNAFNYCSSLESISFPASAELGLSSGIYTNPFTNCSKLIFNLTGTGSLSVIENGKALVRNNTILVAYPSASGNITMNSITALGVKVFYGCSGITDISFPEVTSIGSDAFYGCYNIQDATFPKATSIGSYAFYSSSSSSLFQSRLQSGNFPLVTIIEEYAFSNCPLSTLNIPSVTNIKEDAFYNSGNDALTITMGNSAPNLGLRVFGAGTSSSVKTVKVKIPIGATGYSPAASPFTGTSVTVSGTNSTSNWGNGFRGMGWDGTSTTYNTNAINQNISLTIEKTQ